MINDTSSRYFANYRLDLSGMSSHTYVIKKAGKNKRILEIGTSTGVITEELKKQGNEIIGIEIDANAAKNAEIFCSRMIVGNIEDEHILFSLKDEKFDVIILGDVLEHLKDPSKILKILKSFLIEGGYLIVSIPNFCHGDVLLNLLQGNFNYTNMGLLDFTHLRFFGLKNICSLFQEQGYEIHELNRIIRPLGTTEQMIILEKIPISLQAFISSIPEIEVYQYIFMAYPKELVRPYILPEYSLNQIHYESELFYEGKMRNYIIGLEERNKELEQSIAYLFKKGLKIFYKHIRLLCKISH